MREVVDRFGAVGALVNAAGYGQVGAVQEISVEQLRERRSGHIRNIGSVGGHVSLPTMAVYCASKSAVQNLAEDLTEGLAKELAPLGIRVTLVEPAGFDTDFGADTKLPAASIADYAPAYAAMAGSAGQAVRGDLVRSMAAVAAVADITAADEPPLHLAVATAGLGMVRGRFAELMDEYARWERVTAGTG